MTRQVSRFGLLCVDKPAGCTSRDVVNRLQRLVRPDRIGHAGTLDPLATGVLLVCVGPATRLIELLQQQPKTYDAEFRLGAVSTTDDAEGEISESDVSQQPALADIERALQTFVGEVSQVPPQYSAVKISGQRAYKKAREGETFRISARTVQIHSIGDLQFEWPRLKLRIRCGSGTYIRAIARDLGEALGCGGYMTALRRTENGGFTLRDSAAPEDFSAETIDGLMISPVRLVDGLNRILCSEEEAAAVLQGKVIRGQGVRVLPPERPELSNPNDGRVALLSHDGMQLLALAERLRGRLQPRLVFRV